MPRAEKLNLVAVRCGQFDGVRLFEYRVQGKGSGKEAHRSRDVVNWNAQPHQRLHVHTKHRRTTDAAPSCTGAAAVRVRQPYARVAAEMAQSRVAARRPENATRCALVPMRADVGGAPARTPGGSARAGARSEG